MIHKEVLYERNLLYRKNDDAKIGAAWFKIYIINNEKSVLITLESKEDVNLSEYVKEILNSIEIEVLNRINIDIKKDVLIVLIYQNQYVKVVFEDDLSKNYHLENLDQKEFFSIVNS